jgi:ABC-type Fe3+/spermidine/putrescine transport system ATPase subunit
MQVELKSLQREVGISFVFVTHDQEEAMVMSDRIALLRMGELEQVATPREIYSRPATAYTAQFIGHTNLLRAEVRSGRAHCESLSWPVGLPDGRAAFSVRPEDVRVVAAGTDAAEGAVRFRGKVQHRAFHGATELVRIATGDGLIFSVRTTGVDGRDELECEFSPKDAVSVQDSPERT